MPSCTPYVAAVICLLAARALAVRRLPAHSADDAVHELSNYTCTPAVWDKTVELIRGQQWIELTHNPCLAEDILQELMEGTVDWENIHEVMPSRRYVESMQGCTKILLPKMLYIGLPHAGSTTLADILEQHPDISHGSHKEIHFFSSTPRAMVQNKTLKLRPLEDYTNHFKVPCDTKFTFDGTPTILFAGNPHLDPSQFRYPPGRVAVRHIKHMLGDDIKIVLMVRDPVDWIMSLNHWEDPAMIDLSCVADSLEAWLEVFPREHFLFLKSEDLFRDIATTVDEVISFVGMEAYHADSTFASGRRRHSSREETISLQTRSKFHSDKRNKDCKRRLQQLTGLQFDWPGSE